MNRQTLLIAIVIAAVLAGLVAVVFWQLGGSEETAAEQPGTEPAAPEVDAEAEAWTPDLYFPGDGERLHAERRELPPAGGVEERITALVEALLAGPSGAGLQAPLPEGVHLRKVYLAENGLAYLDFQSPDGAPPPASGSLREILTIYSLVDTVLLNFEQLDRVVLLWNGRQLQTFAGHVDTMRPLAAEADLIAAAP
jgi:spore germination protein GerM